MLQDWGEGGSQQEPNKPWITVTIHLGAVIWFALIVMAWIPK
jgi:hypothetical protein